MTIIEALNSKQIRYGAGRYFDAATKPGENLWIENIEQLPAFLKGQFEDFGYEGAVFVRFDEQLPAEVPTDAPAHTWAWALQVGKAHEQIGAVVLWSTEEKEADYRAARDRAVSFDEFNVRRQGGEL